MILQEFLATRWASRVSPLFSLAKDSVLLSLTKNNSQERLARPLVAWLGEKLKWKDWKTGQELLWKMASFSGKSNYCIKSFVFIINISGFQGENYTGGICNSRLFHQLCVEEFYCVILPIPPVFCSCSSDKSLC